MKFVFLGLATLIAGASLMGSNVLAASNDKVQIEETVLNTSRGSKVPVMVHVPESGSGKSAAIVVAPGQGCNSRNMLLQNFAEQAARLGYVVVRMEWSYCALPKDQWIPHPQYLDQIQEIETVLEFARHHRAVDSSRMVLAGKSLGTLAGYPVFRRELALKAGVMLTPVCSYDTDEHDQPIPAPLPVGEENYPDLKSETRPMIFASGDNDMICRLPVLREFLKDKGANITKFETKGTHSWTIGDPIDEKATRENIEASVASVLAWLQSVVKP